MTRRYLSPAVLVMTGCRVIRHPAQHDAEVVQVRRQQHVVRIQLLLGPGPALGPDEHPAADGHPAAWSQPGADRAAGEVRQRRGLLPPARRDAVSQRPPPRLETVLGPAVLQHVDVSRVGIGEPEPPGRIVLVIPGFQQQRIVAVTAEAHVGEPRPAAVGRAYDERQMIERRAQVGLPVYPGGGPGHLRAERLKQQRERPVELVAEAAAAPAHDLVDQVALIQRDRLGQVNAQVLERHCQLVRAVQRAQARRVTNNRRRDADPVQVGHHGLVIHRHPPERRKPLPAVMTITRISFGPGRLDGLLAEEQQDRPGRVVLLTESGIAAPAHPANHRRRPSFQISGKGAGFARTGLGIAAHGYASSEMPDQGKIGNRDWLSLCILRRRC